MADPDATRRTGRYEAPVEITDFRNRLPKELKAMLDDVDAERVREVAQNWQDVHDELVGADGKGGVKKKFDDAVTKVLKGWTGDAAEKFYTQSQKISRNFANGAPYAQATANAMGQAADDLKEALVQYHNIDWDPASRALQAEAEEMMMQTVANGGGATCSPPPPVSFETAPLWAEDMGNMSGKIESWNMVQSDLSAGMSTEQALAKHSGTTGKHGLPKFLRQTLEASIAMEKLGNSYAVKSRELRPPEATESGDIPPREKDGGDGRGGATGGGLNQMKPGPVKDVSGGGVGTPQTLSMDPSAGDRRRDGAQVGTGLDGLDSSSSGMTTPGSGGVGAMNSAGGGGSGGLAAGAPSGVMATGSAGQTGGRVAGAAGKASGAGMSTGAASGSSGSRGGMTPGMGGGAGAAGGKAGNPGGKGSAGRKLGGAVGGARGASVDRQGGAGLHRSRGGSDHASRSGRGPGLAGTPAAPAGSGGARRDANRPDYLAEEEETWAPKRNVAPRVIE